jgi:hypothetical protein
VLAELAIANAAFGVIKETIANGGDIMAAGQHLFKFFDNKAEIAKKATKSGSDSEAFFALEQIKQSELELRELMQWQGRAGLWDDWLQFQSDAKRKREAEARAIALKKRKRIQMVKDVFSTIAIILLGITGLGAVLLLAWVIINKGL